MEAGLFREVEKHTLRRDELLSRLRKQLLDFEKGYSSLNEIKKTLERLKVSRMAMLRALSRGLEVSEVRDFRESLATLLEFNLWISLSDEKEQFRKLLSLIKLRGAGNDPQASGMISYVKDELAGIELLERVARERLRMIRDS